MANTSDLLPIQMARAVAAKSDSGAGSNIIQKVLEIGVGRPLVQASYDDKRKRKTKEEKLSLAIRELMDDTRLEAATPRSITAVPASAIDILSRQSVAGLSALHYTC